MINLESMDDIRTFVINDVPLAADASQKAEHRNDLEHVIEHLGTKTSTGALDHNSQFLLALAYVQRAYHLRQEGKRDEAFAILTGEVGPNNQNLKIYALDNLPINHRQYFFCAS